MTATIQPAQYVFIAEHVKHLVNDYHTVNDPKTIQAVQALTVEKIQQLFPTENLVIKCFLAKILDVRLTQAQADSELAVLKEAVIPFQKPSKQQLEKAFRKVKKLKLPEWEALDLQAHTYVGWNDPGSQKKFLVYYSDDKLQGLSGDFSPNIKKNICAICHKTSEVALFMATTKTAGDGTYTKRGNYICHDSVKCNQQLRERVYFDDFAATVLPQK